MSIRMPLSIQTRQMLLGLQQTQDRIAQNTQRISSGQRITNPGDDPAGAALILDLGTSLGTNTQFQSQAASALSFLQSTDTALGSVTSDLTQLLQIGQQGLSGTSGSTGRAALASTVDGLRSNLLDLANTQIQGKFIFAGTKTTNATNTPPFALTATGASYAGDSNTINLGISATAQVGMNVPGDTVFFGPGGAGSSTDLFKAVTDLQTGLSTNNTTLIQQGYDNIQNALTNVTQAQTEVGGRESRLNDLQNILSAQGLSLQNMQNAEQDTNYPATITQFTSDQTVQNATLNALGKLNQPNLFNYLG